MMRKILSLALLALPVFSVTPSNLRADDSRPFKGTISFAAVSSKVLPDGTLYVAGTLSGKLTVIGKFEGTVEYIIASDGSFTGKAVKIDTHGNKLFESVVGQFTTTGSFGTVKVTGGTGKFHEATGHSTFLSQWIIPGVTATIAIDGVIELDD